MGLRINTNVSALNAQRNLNNNQGLLSKSLERLSSGLRINRAADDAAGLAIAMKLLAQTGGLGQAINNTQDSISLIQTAEGGIDATTNILQRMRELAIQSANDTLTNDDRKNIQEEVNQLRDELTRIAETTEFNGRKLLDGSIASTTSKVNSTATIAQNTRVGDTSATVPNVTDFVTSIASVTTDATSDVSFQFEITSSSVPGSFNLVVRSSLEGVILGGAGALITIGPGSSTTQISLSVQGVVVGTVNINAGNVATNDIGETAVIQLSQRRTAVTTDNSLTFHVGANEGQSVRIGVDDLRAAALKVESLNLVGTNDADSRIKAQNAIGVIDNALNYVSKIRSRLGASQNRLESTISRLGISQENLTSALSRIRDADVATETSNLTRAQILVQAGTAVLTQANVSRQNILNLL